MHSKKRRRALNAVVALAGAVGATLGVWSFGAVADATSWAVVVLAGAGFASVPARVRSNVLLSLVNVVAFTAFLLGGPALAVAAPLGAVVGEARRYVRPVAKKIAFNLGQISLAAWAAGVVYEAVAPPTAVQLLWGGDTAGLVSARAAAALLLAGLVFTAVNFGAVALAVALNSGERYRSALRSSAGAFALQPLYLGLSILAVVLIVDVHVAAVVLLLVPAIVARTGLVALQREAEAYDELVLALVKLIEVKDGYTRGHAERVSLLAVEIASELAYDYEQRRTARYAALLHDVGKIAVPLGILRKPAALTDDEYQRVKTHPEVGVEVLDEIDFLGDALPGILHHHERVDGRGYPHGLSGDEIPELARIITVVDAFDAMTSTRAYRRALDVETALERIRSSVGTQFDARIVEAFERVVLRVDWVPTDTTPGADIFDDLQVQIDLAAVEQEARA